MSTMRCIECQDEGLPFEGCPLCHRVGADPHEQGSPEPSTPYRLPIVTLRGVEWFVDERLGELRQVANPHETLDWVSESWADDEAALLAPIIDAEQQRHARMA